MNTKRNIVIALIIAICLIGGITYALFKWTSTTNTNVTVELNGYDDYVNYIKGVDTLDDNFSSSNDYTGGKYATITLNKNVNATNIPLYGHIYLDINTIGSKIAAESSMKWILMNGDNTSATAIANGNFMGKSNGSSISLASNLVLGTTTQQYTLWIWLDDNAVVDDTIIGDNLDVSIRVEVTGKQES